MSREFHAPAPNRLRLSDVTYVAAWAGFVHVALVIDALATLTYFGLQIGSVTTAAQYTVQGVQFGSGPIINSVPE